MALSLPQLRKTHVVYKDLDQLQGFMAREASMQQVNADAAKVAAARLHDSSWFPNIEAGGQASVAATESMILGFFGAVLERAKS